MNDELMHHGVKGMKWGVRRYQNEDGSLTSAGKKRQAKRDQKAAKYYDRANERQREIDSISKSLNSTDKNHQKRKIEKDINKLEKKRAQDLEDAHAKEQGKLTKKQKQAIAIGAAVAATYATYKFVDSGHATQMIAKGKSALGKGELDFKKNPNLAKANMDSDELMSSVVSRINPDYGAVGTKNNCRRCTFAYEMSRRGYDVKATKSVGGTGQALSGVYNTLSPGEKKLGKWSYVAKLATDDKKAMDVFDRFQGIHEIVKKDHGIEGIVEHKNKPTVDTIFNTLSTQPNGSRGELQLKWGVDNRSLGAHSVVYEIVNNKPVIFDCQSGTAYKTAAELKKLTNQRGMDVLSGASFIRLDDKEFDTDFLLRWLQNA